MLILLSWSGEAMSDLDRARICSGLTCPGSPSDADASSLGRIGNAVVSGEISSTVDLNRTAGPAGSG